MTRCFIETLICGLFSVAFLHPLREGRRVLWDPRLRGRLGSQAKSKRFLQSTVQLQLTEKNLSPRAFQREKETQGLWRKEWKTQESYFLRLERKWAGTACRGWACGPPGSWGALGAWNLSTDWGCQPGMTLTHQATHSKTRIAGISTELLWAPDYVLCSQ